MRVSIYGYGVVGKALSTWLDTKTTHHQSIVDPDKFQHEDTIDSQAIFICIPVPTLEDRTQDLTAVREIIKRERGLNRNAPIFLKSTVLPGTCDQLSYEFDMTVIALPEFLSERTAYQDFDRQPILAGGMDRICTSRLLSRLFPGKEIISVRNSEAELAKYVHNCFGAMKVNYFNMVEEICNTFGLDYLNVVRAARLTGYIEKTHTQVPGHDGYGFGGKCFPKDLKAFIGFADFVLGHRFTTHSLAAIEKENEYFRKKQPNLL